jgi:hypothetical protein
MAPDHPLARHDVITPELLHDQNHITLKLLMVYASDSVFL